MKYKIIGVMTGNSLDAVDTVLTEFDADKITDLGHYSIPYPEVLRNNFLDLRRRVNQDNLSMEALNALPQFIQTHDTYIHLVADAINTLVKQAQLKPSDITAIGFHGQTLDHCGTAMAKKTGTDPYTLQIGSGQMLSNLTQIPVIYDFRSEDVMNGGEGAPLAPTHNKNLAKNFGIQEAIFYNAGNTSNIAVLSGTHVMGWDAGPFNEFADKMVRIHRGEPFDMDGVYGLQGTVDMDLLRTLFNNSAVTPSGDNFLELTPPRSSDPKWYRFLPVLQQDDHFFDKVRTVEYFSAYAAVYTLNFVPQEWHMPSDFILFGGGWHNPISRAAFEALLKGTADVLLEHAAVFKAIRARFDREPTIQMSSFGQYMEARIFADLARYFLENKKWLEPMGPDHIPTVLGVRRTPNEGPIDDRISWAAKGWKSATSLGGTI